MRIQVTAVLFIAAATACGSPKKVDIGDENEVVLSELSAYVATWDGYAEGFNFNGDNADRVRITINSDGSGNFRVGDEDLFGGATDGNSLYPPTFSDTIYPMLYPLTGLRSGFEFPIVDPRVSDERLQFEVNRGELMESWCALQPSMTQGWTCGSYPGAIVIPSSEGQHQCYLSDGDTTQGWTNGVTGDLSATNTPVDCNVAVQCYHCTCDSDGCHAKFEPIMPQIDAELSNDGEKLEGTLILGPNERITVRMQRQP